MQETPSNSSDYFCKGCGGVCYLYPPASKTKGYWLDWLGNNRFGRSRDGLCQILYQSDSINIRDKEEWIIWADLQTEMYFKRAEKAF